MAGFIQVPADGVGKRVDTVTLTDAAVEVHRQKVVLSGGSGTAEVVVVTNAAPAATDMGIVVRQAGTATVTGVVILGAGAANIGTINNISATVAVSGQVSLGAGTSNIGTINNISATVVTSGLVGLTAGTSVIGDINAISRTVQVAIATPFILQGISTTVQVAIATPFTVNNISAAVVLAAGASNIGSINNISATVTVAGTLNISATHSVILAAGTANFGTLNDISRTVQVAIGTPFTVNNISATVAVSGLVGLTAGTSVIGDINAISRTVQVAIGTPFTLQGISTTVNVAIATPFILQGISTTVQVAIATPFTVNNISRTVVCGLSYVIETGGSQVTVGDSANSAIRVNIVAGAVGGTGGTSIADGTPFTAQSALLNPVGGIFDDAASDTLSEGDAGIVRVTTNRAFHVNMRTDGGAAMEDSANSALRVNVVAGSAGGPSMVDNATYSTGVSLVAPAGYIFFSASATAVTDGRIAAARITDSRAVHTNLRNNAGTEIGTNTTPLSVKVETTSATASVILAAGAANIGTINNISAAVTTTGLVGLTAGTSVIGDINAISRTVQVAIGTPFTLQGISTTVSVAIATPYILQGISTTVQVAIATPYILQGISTTVSVITSAQMAHDSSVTVGVVPVQMGLRAGLSAQTAVTAGDATYAWADRFGRQVVAINHPSLPPTASHGPKCVTCSTSAGIALIAAPGAGLCVYITSLACTNGSGTLTRADVFQVSATASCVCQMYMAASGGGFTMDYNPPIKILSNSGVTCRVDPSVSQAIFNVHFYVGNK